MQHLASTLIARRPRPLRLLIALLLGLQFGLLAFYQPASSSGLWVPWLPLLILLAAMAASIWFDPRVRSGNVDAEDVLRGLLRFLLLLLLPIAVLGISFLFIHSVGALVLGLIPLVLGVITAFTLIGKRQIGTAVLCGLLAWLGVGGPFLLSSYLASKQPSNELGGWVFLLLIVGVVVGFAFAALGGFFGLLLRRWVLG